jgi:Cys-rich protein (TIGR01571 family)
MSYGQPPLYGQGYQQPGYPQMGPYPPQNQPPMGQYAPPPPMYQQQPGQLNTFNGSPPYGNPQAVYGANFMPPVQLNMDVPLGPHYNPETERRMYGQWSDGLFDCFHDGKLCCLGTLFPCYPIYIIFSRLPQMFRTQAKICCCDSPMGAAFCCCITPVIGYIFGPCLLLCYARNIRDAVARRFMIRPARCFFIRQAPQQGNRIHRLIIATLYF